jgi:DNA-binding CsgD family transcriptional regulator
MCRNLIAHNPPVNDLSDDLGAGVLATYTWDVRGDEWTWSDEGYRLHGYQPGEVLPTFALAVKHKLPAGRAKAERVLSRAAEAGFRYSNHHRIVDAAGRERVVVSGGVTRMLDGRSVVHGFMVDVTVHADTLVPALDAATTTHRALSVRERQVLGLVAAGRTNAEIAEELFVSINSVKTYLHAAYRKIGIHRRSQAVAWVLAHPTLVADPLPADRLL